MNDIQKIEHQKIIDSFLKTNINGNVQYMLTISRDGESPARSIYIFNDALLASEAYNRYTDWGFAKNYLTVRLYQPNNLITEKVLRRPEAGECTFIKKDYFDIAEILLSAKPFINDNYYDILVNQIAKIFSKDNIRFDYVRFLKNTNAKEVEING